MHCLNYKVPLKHFSSLHYLPALPKNFRTQRKRPRFQKLQLRKLPLREEKWLHVKPGPLKEILGLKTWNSEETEKWQKTQLINYSDVCVLMPNVKYFIDFLTDVQLDWNRERVNPAFAGYPCSCSANEKYHYLPYLFIKYTFIIFVLCVYVYFKVRS